MNTIDYDDIIPQMKYFICRHCTPDWIMNKSYINFIDLTYIFDGKVTYTIDGVSYEAEKGDLVCIPRGSMRQARINPDNPMACYASNIWLFNLKGNQEVLPFPVVSKIGIRDDIMSMYHDLNMEWIHKKPGYNLKVCSIFLSILHCYFNILYFKAPYNSADQRIQTVTNYIYDNLGSRINVDDLASLIGLNTSYFGTLFNKTTGLSVKEYVNRIRIDNAENLLSSGEYSVNEAAHRSGFDDAFYFSRVFKKIKGYSPSKVALNVFLNKQEK